jgi:hypothetical protein
MQMTFTGPTFFPADLIRTAVANGTPNPTKYIKKAARLSKPQSNMNFD